MLEQSEEKQIEQTCRFCGCDFYHPCPGGCYWVAEDICSACAIKEELGFQVIDPSDPFSFFQQNYSNNIRGGKLLC